MWHASPLGIVMGLAANTVREDRKGYNNFVGSQLGVARAAPRRAQHAEQRRPLRTGQLGLRPALKLDAGLRWSNVLDS